MMCEDRLQPTARGQHTAKNMQKRGRLSAAKILQELNLLIDTNSSVAHALGRNGKNLLCFAYVTELL